MINTKKKKQLFSISTYGNQKIKERLYVLETRIQEVAEVVIVHVRCSLHHINIVAQ